MRSLLNTIPIETPFAYERQGYWANYHTGVPIADGSNLLSFYSMPFDPIVGATVNAWLKCINGDHAYHLGELPYIERNDKWTFYHDGSDTGAVVPMGYYYVEATAYLPQAGVGNIYSDYIIRVERQGGITEAESCLLDTLLDISGGVSALPLFKTEPFWMPQAGTLPEKSGDFNRDFNTDFLL